MKFEDLTEEYKRAPASGPVQIDDTNQRLAMRLARARQRARSIYLVVIVIIVALFSVLVFQVPQLVWSFDLLIATLINTPVLNWQPIAGWSPLLITLWLLLASVILLLFSAPFAWYISDYLPRRYAVSKGTTRQWLRLFASALLLVWGQGWLLVEVVTLLLAVQPQTWWIWAALAQFLYSVLVSHTGWLRFLLYHGDIQPLTEGEIAARFQVLLQRLHLPACRLFQFKVSHRTGAANAFFIGWGSGRRVLLTDTMLQRFSPDEIEVVLAHELGHLVHHDIWTRLVMRGLSFLGFFYVLALSIYSSQMTPDDSDHAELLWLGIVLLLLVFNLLTVRYRRYQEYRADEFALRSTGKAQAFKDAMTRLTNMNLLVATSTRRARHPASHPTLLKRLKHADEFAARNAAPVELKQAL